MGLCGVQPHCAQTKARPYGAKQSLGRRPKPALLFLIAEKEGKKASPLGTYKTYFEPGVLQLPTVGQIKRLYNSVQNRFYKQVLKGAFNSKTATATTKKQREKSIKKPCQLIGRLISKNIKISKNRLKIKGRGERFLGKIILKI